MPRVFTSQNEALDFCIRHFPKEQVAQQKYGNLGDGPDGRGNCFGWDAEHPPYEGIGYVCYVCKKTLTGLDDSII